MFRATDSAIFWWRCAGAPDRAAGSRIGTRWCRARDLTHWRACCARSTMSLCALHAIDKAFFYSAFVVEEVI